MTVGELKEKLDDYGDHVEVVVHDAEDVDSPYFQVAAIESRSTSEGFQVVIITE